MCFEGLAMSPEALGALMGTTSPAFPPGGEQGCWEAFLAPASQHRENIRGVLARLDVFGLGDSEHKTSRS